MSDKKEIVKRKVNELLQDFMDSETNRESEETIGSIIDYLEDKQSEYDILADAEEAEPVDNIEEEVEGEEIDLDDDSDEDEEDDELDEKFEL